MMFHFPVAHGSSWPGARALRELGHALQETAKASEAKADGRECQRFEKAEPGKSWENHGIDGTFGGNLDPKVAVNLITFGNLQNSCRKMAP